MWNHSDDLDKQEFSHKGIYTFDLLFAVLIILIMFYFAVSTAMEFSRELSSAHLENEGRHKAFLISENIISRDISVSDIQSHQNYVDPAKLSRINTTKYLQDFRINAMNVSTSFSDSISEGTSGSPNTYCYRRIVLVRDILSYPGTLRVCIQRD
jgi:hypothetical protein